MLINNSQINSSDLGQVFTKQSISDYMVNLFTLPKNSIIIDPCFGKGVFIDSLISLKHYQILGFEIDSVLFNNYANSSTHRAKLFCEDYLSYNTPLVDGIIMNPPYIRHEKINTLSCFGVTKDILHTTPMYSLLPKNANMYMYFILKSISTVRVGGEIIVIFPEVWLNSKSGEIFKNIINKNCTVQQKIFVKGEAFETSASVDVVILKLVKSKIQNHSFIEKNIFISNTKILTSEAEDKSPLKFNLLTKLSSYASARRGITTGCNEIFVNPKIEGKFNKNTFTQKIISSPKSILGYNCNNALCDELLTIQEDSSIPNAIKKYISNWENKILEIKTPKTLYDKIINKKSWYKISTFSGNGILFSYIIRNSMKFLYNQEDFLVRDNFYLIYPKINIMLLFALLNNYFTYYQIENLGKRYGAGVLKVQKYDIDNILFPSIEEITEEDKTKLIHLSKLLIDTDDNSIIKDITAILSRYYNHEIKQIMHKYNEIKNERLGKNNDQNK